MDVAAVTVGVAGQHQGHGLGGFAEREAPNGPLPLEPAGALSTARRAPEGVVGPRLAGGAAERSPAIGSVEVSHDPLDSVSSSRSWVRCAPLSGGADATRRGTVLPMFGGGDAVVPSVVIADRPPLDRPRLDRPRGGADPGLG